MKNKLARFGERMPLITVDGIVVKYADYKENDRMLTVFTKEYGALSVSARGCKRQGSRLITCSELFVLCEFVLFDNRGRYTVNSCTLKESFYAIREDMRKLTAAAFAAELSAAFEHGNQRSDELFSMIYHALSYICYGDCDAVDIAICFAVRFLAELGYSPMLTSCALCGADIRSHTMLAFSSRAGGALCENCARDGRKVSALALEAVRRMLNLSDIDMKKVKLPQRVRDELVEIIPEYAENMLEHKFRSAKQLRQ